MGEVHFEKRNAVAWITLDNPTKHNAIDAAMSARMYEAYAEIQSNADIRVCVIVGAGDKAFCSGGDMSTYVAKSVIESSGTGAPTLIPKPDSTSKPYIAAIRGHCVGGGFGLALACDLRIAANDAKFAAVGLRRGIVPAGQQAERLVKLIPFGKALEMLLLAETVDAQQALASGLVQKVVEVSQLHEAAEKWAERIAGFNPVAVMAAKKLAYNALTMNWQDSFEYGAGFTNESLRSEEGLRGFAAFLEGKPDASLDG